MQFLVSLIEKYGLFAVFLNVFLEGVGLPIPSYPILMIAAALATQLHHAYAEIVIAGSCGALLADSLWFWAGRQYGARIVKLLCRISLSPDSCVQNTNVMFVKIGPSSLSFAKFIPGFSTVSIVLASAMRISAQSVAFFDAIGVFLYISAGVVLGVVFQDAVADALTLLSRLGHAGIAVVVAAFALFVFTKRAQRKRAIDKLRMNRITVGELRTLIEDGANPLILDVRPDTLRQNEGVIPGSVVARVEELKAIAQRFPMHSEVVVYCNCPNEASAVFMARKLEQAGFRKIRPLLGGIDAWTKAGHTVDMPSLESPVRLAA